MNLNLVQVIGRITKQPELRTTPGGVTVGSFGVASNRQWKDKNGQKASEAEFHNIVAFGRTAEVIAQYFNKGDEIYIAGRLKTSTWKAQDGSNRYRTDIVAERFDFGQKVGGGTNRAQNEQSAPASQNEYAGDPYFDTSAPVDDGSQDGEIKVEDIPF